MGFPHECPGEEAGCGGEDGRYAAAVRILLVEDYPPLVRAVTQGLQEAGYAVDAATDGEAGGLDQHPGDDGGLRPIRSARWPVPIIPTAHMNG